MSCAACGNDMPPSKGRKPRRFCSPTCSHWARRHPGERRLAQRQCGNCSTDISHMSYKARFCSKQCNDAVRTWQMRPPRQCNGCGVAVKSCGRWPVCADCRLIRRREQRRKSWQRRRALLRGVASEPYTLSEIAARDGFRCGLCGRKVTMKRSAPHPQAPVVDHIVPLARGGEDTRVNVHLAHWGCNASKGCGGGNEQLALVG